MIVILVQTD